jgi:transposase
MSNGSLTDGSNLVASSVNEAASGPDGVVAEALAAPSLEGSNSADRVADGESGGGGGSGGALATVAGVTAGGAATGGLVLSDAEGSAVKAEISVASNGRGGGERVSVSTGKEKSGTLSNEQRTALELLVLGKSVSEAARTSGVSRVTIYSWMKRDATFQACYNGWQDEMRKSCRGRLMKMTDKAASAVQAALDRGNAQVAMQLLKGMGMIGPVRVGATNPEEVKMRMELKNRRKAVRLAEADAKVEMGERTGLWRLPEGLRADKGLGRGGK